MVIVQSQIGLNTEPAKPAEKKVPQNHEGQKDTTATKDTKDPRARQSAERAAKRKGPRKYKHDAALVVCVCETLDSTLNLAEASESAGPRSRSCRAQDARMCP